jgi:hypothetical protein
MKMKFLKVSWQKLTLKNKIQKEQHLVDMRKSENANTPVTEGQVQNQNVKSASSYIVDARLPQIKNKQHW